VLRQHRSATRRVYLGRGVPGVVLFHARAVVLELVQVRVVLLVLCMLLQGVWGVGGECAGGVNDGTERPVRK